MRFPAARSLIAVIAVVLLAACASDGTDDAVYTQAELRTMEREAAGQSYETAREYLLAGNPQQALEIYREIQARFPFTEHATQSELESITAQYLGYQHDAAVSAANRFIKQHPRHPNIEYAYYLRGLINYDRVDDSSFVGGDATKRDPTHLRRAFTDFNLLISNYPNSVYNKDAQLRMVEIKHRLADYELNIAEYYLQRRGWVAAARRAESIIDRYQGADAIPRALEVMEHSYRMLGLEDLAQDTRTILQVSYPNYILHREEFYRQRAGDDPNYDLPPMDGPPAVPTGEES